MMFKASISAILFIILLIPLAATEYCGTFTLTCKKQNAPACNNACFDYYCRNNQRQFTKATSAQKKRNKFTSGCSIDSNSVCTVSLFAKMFSDPKSLQNPTCDEWPPKSVVQDPDHPASLRCMEESQNRAGGKELNDFVNNARSSGNSCNRQLEGGDTFDVDFDFDPNLTGIPYCIGKGSPESCAQDGFQFLLTNFVEPKGHVSEPYYTYDSDNHYALHRSPNGHQSALDIKMCQTSLLRSEDNGKINYELSVGMEDNDGNGASHLDMSDTFDKATNSITVGAAGTGLDYSLSASPVDPEKKDSKVIFKYGNLVWRNDKDVILGGGKRTPWCFANEAVGNLYNNRCTFPCSGRAAPKRAMNGKGKSYEYGWSNMRRT